MGIYANKTLSHLDLEALSVCTINALIYAKAAAISGYLLTVT